MPNVGRRQQTSAGDCHGCLADQTTIHNDLTANGKVIGREFMFRGDIRDQSVRLAFEVDDLSLLQVNQGDEHIVFGVELEDLMIHNQKDWASSLPHACA